MAKVLNVFSLLIKVNVGFGLKRYVLQIAPSMKVEQIVLGTSEIKHTFLGGFHVRKKFYMIL